MREHGIWIHIRPSRRIPGLKCVAIWIVAIGVVDVAFAEAIEAEGAVVDYCCVVG
jgi:hypothetical protein